MQDRAAFLVPPQELLLSGHAEELSDIAIRLALVRRGAPRRRRRRERTTHRDHARAHGGGHGQEPPRWDDRAYRRSEVLAHRLQPRGHPFGRGRERAGRPLAAGGAAIPDRAARHPADARRQRRTDGRGLDAMRRQRLVARARYRGARNQG